MSQAPRQRRPDSINSDASNRAQKSKYSDSEQERRHQSDRSSTDSGSDPERKSQRSHESNKATRVSTGGSGNSGATTASGGTHYSGTATGLSGSTTHPPTTKKSSTRERTETGLHPQPPVQYGDIVDPNRASNETAPADLEPYVDRYLDLMQMGIPEKSTMGRKIKAYKDADIEAERLHKKAKKYRSDNQADQIQLRTQKKSGLPKELYEFQGQPAGDLKYHKGALNEVDTAIEATERASTLRRSMGKEFVATETKEDAAGHKERADTLDKALENLKRYKADHEKAIAALEEREKLVKGGRLAQAMAELSVADKKPAKKAKAPTQPERGGPSGTQPERGGPSGTQPERRSRRPAGEKPKEDRKKGSSRSRSRDPTKK